jgi:hypothetical protein
MHTMREEDDLDSALGLDAEEDSDGFPDYAEFDEPQTV